MTNNLFSLKEKTAIITGGLGLIGASLVKSLLEHEAIVYIIDTIKKEEAIKIIDDKFNEKLNNLFYLKADITNKESLLIAKEEILKKHKIDILINCAALTHKVEDLKKNDLNFKFEEMPIDEWNREIFVNLTGTMLSCQVFGSQIENGGSIINISSIYGVVAPDQSIYQEGYKQPPAYGVSKAGIMALTRYLATYWGEKNIRVNSLVLGGIENGQNQEFLNNYKKKTPLGRMAKLEDLNGALIYLASESSRYTTGSAIFIDGGWTCW